MSNFLDFFIYLNTKRNVNIGLTHGFLDDSEYNKVRLQNHVKGRSSFRSQLLVSFKLCFSSMAQLMLFVSLMCIRFGGLFIGFIDFIDIDKFYKFDITRSFPKDCGLKNVTSTDLNDIFITGSCNCSTKQIADRLKKFLGEKGVTIEETGCKHSFNFRTSAIVFMQLIRPLIEFLGNQYD